MSAPSEKLAHFVELASQAHALEVESRNKRKALFKQFRKFTREFPEATIDAYKAAFPNDTYWHTMSRIYNSRASTLQLKKIFTKLLEDGRYDADATVF